MYQNFLVALFGSGSPLQSLLLCNYTLCLFKNFCGGGVLLEQEVNSSWTPLKNAQEKRAFSQPY
jgi:hypothetical protein